MSTPNPLVPQGSLQQQSASRNRTRMLVFGVIAVHVVALGGLLFQGCSKPTDAGTTAGTETPSTSTLPQTDAGLLPTNDIHGSAALAPTSSVPSIPVNNTPLPGASGAALQPAGNGQLPGALPPGGVSAVPGSPSYVTPTPGLTPTPSTGYAPTPTVATPETTAPLTTSEGSDYVIKKGDILERVAKNNKVTLKALEAANPGLDARKLKIGQTIKIPAAGKPAAAPTSTGGSTSTAAAATEIGSYKVKKGDTLTNIAKKHSTTLKELRRLNGLKTDQIKVDQTIKVPVKAAPAPVTAPEPAPVVTPYVPPATTPPVSGTPGTTPGTFPTGRP